MTDPETIVRHARSLGVTLAVSGDRIRYAPKSQTPEAFVDLLRENKQELLGYLASSTDLSSTDCTLNPQNPQNFALEASAAASANLETERLLAWSSELADADLELPSPVTYIEAPLRTVSTERVSWYAGHYLRTIAYARLSQATGGWGSWTPGWWKQIENDAVTALQGLREGLAFIGHWEKTV